MTADHVDVDDTPNDVPDETADDDVADAGDLGVLAHEGPWTEAAYLDLVSAALRRGDGRAELVDGVLLVGPGPSEERTHVVDRLREAITAALPEGLRVVGPVAVRLSADCVLVPDLVVARALTRTYGPPGSDADGGPEQLVPGTLDGTAPEVLDAADVLMVVEVVGREHGDVDRSFKPQVYARGRIPYSVLLDRDGPYAAANMIIGGRYHEYARVSADGVLTVDEPFPLTIPVRGPELSPEPPPPAPPER